MTNVNPLDAFLAEMEAAAETPKGTLPKYLNEIRQDFPGLVDELVAEEVPEEPEPVDTINEDFDALITEHVPEEPEPTWQREILDISPDDEETGSILAQLVQDDAPETSSISIATAAMLVEFSVSQWSETKKDRALAEEIAASKGIDPKYVNATKQLLGKCPELAAISQFVNKVRNDYHYKMTLPFYDSGIRLIPTSMYFDYVKAMSQYQKDFADLVERFVQVYVLRIASCRAEMGSLFDERLYPEPSKVRSRFSFNFNFSPVPEAGDFRVDIAEDQRREVASQYRGFYQSQIQKAMGHLWNELYESLQFLSSQLDFTGKDKAKKLYDSRFSDMGRMIKMLESVNVSKDPKLSRLTLQLRQTFDGVNVEALRNNETVRVETKRAVDSALAGMPSLGGLV